MTTRGDYQNENVHLKNVSISVEAGSIRRTYAAWYFQNKIDLYMPVSWSCAICLISNRGPDNSDFVQTQIHNGYSFIIQIIKLELLEKVLETVDN